MAKGQWTGYIDYDKIDKIKEMGFVPSQVIDSALSVILSNDFDDVALKLKIEWIEQSIEEAEELQRRLQLKLISTRERIEEMTREREEMKSTYQHVTTVVKLQTLMKSLNQLIIINQYDAFVIEKDNKQLIDDIHKLNPTFSLESHVRRFEARRKKMIY